jgi:signal transduction histidine kinase
MFLERLFFHDILNTTTSLAGTIMLLKNFKQKVNADELIERADVITQTLVDEIRSHQIVLYAENNLLKINPSPCNSMDLLAEISNFYAIYEFATGKTVQIDPASESIEITTDKTLIKRVLGNMVKNALEATSEGDTVTLGCSVVDGDKVRFTVHNPGFISRDVQLQIFTRSFSTKSPDRGLGTYSMKLLSTFLSGEVTFETSEELGTIFIATYPLVVQPSEPAEE